MEPNAVQDILEGARFEGMIDTIRPVTDAVDIVFTTVITFVAFFIISVALLRNVLAGAYCAFPKFWEQVAKAHEENDDKAFFSAITGIKDSYKTASMSSVRTALLRLVPNIKNLTDFEDNTLSPKAYFIKAIPQMIAVVIIGVFIYNGYYRDAVSIVASTGSEIIERTVLSFDPMGAFDTIMNTAGRPDFATDNAVTALDKNKNKVATEIYSQIISKYTDIKDANSKSELAKQIDDAVDAMFGTSKDNIDNLTKYFAAEDGSYTITTRVEIVKEFDPSRYTNTEDTDRVQFCWKVGLGREDNMTHGEMPEGFKSKDGDLDIMFDSTTDAAKNEKWCVRVMAKATRNVVKTTSTKDVYVTLGNGTYTIPAGGGSVANMKYTKDGGTVIVSNTDRTITVASLGTSDSIDVNLSFTMKSDMPDNQTITVHVTKLAGSGITLDKSQPSWYAISTDKSGNLSAQKQEKAIGGTPKDDNGDKDETAESDESDDAPVGAG